MGNIKKINAAFVNPKILIVIILNTYKPIKHFVVFGIIMHAYIYARRRRNLAILRILTINFFGFSNAAFIFFTFSHLLDFTFSHLLYSTFSHLYIFTSLHLYIFTSFAFLSFCILHFSLLRFLL